MKYSVNPCEICKKIYKEPEFKVDAVNSCVANTSAAFLGYPSNEIIQGKNYDNWQQCISDTIDERININQNDYKVSINPVFGQSAHYFPKIFNKTNDVQKSYEICNKYCAKERLKNECSQNCYIDANSLLPIKENFNDIKTTQNDKPKTTQNDKPKKPDNKKIKSQNISLLKVMKEHPIIFWLSFLVYMVLFLFILYTFIKSLFTNFN
tara:strand:- start:8502 stop:9125 length:624 start_codon:yes stop_codon:yes gene_type:complete